MQGSTKTNGNGFVLLKCGVESKDIIHSVNSKEVKGKHCIIAISKLKSVNKLECQNQLSIAHNPWDIPQIELIRCFF